MSDEAEHDGKLVREMIVKGRLGFHARPAAMMVKVASEFDADVTIETEAARVSAKSVMGLLGLEAAFGTKIRVEAEGPDAQDALDEIEKLMESGFGE